MRLRLRTWCWLFIFAVAVADVAFAFRFRHTLPDWEINPAGRWAFIHSGFWGLVACRVGFTLFAWRVAYTSARGSRFITPVWLLAHAGLAVYLGTCLSEAARVGRVGPPPGESAYLQGQAQRMAGVPRALTIAFTAPTGPHVAISGLVFRFPVYMMVARKLAHRSFDCLRTVLRTLEARPPASPGVTPRVPDNSIVSKNAMPPRFSYTNISGPLVNSTPH
jgi:hypothetical protein